MFGSVTSQRYLKTRSLLEILKYSDKLHRSGTLNPQACWRSSNVRTICIATLRENQKPAGDPQMFRPIVSQRYLKTQSCWRSSFDSFSPVSELGRSREHSKHLQPSSSSPTPSCSCHPHIEKTTAVPPPPPPHTHTHLHRPPELRRGLRGC